jgi:hypothetical protein
MSYQNILSFLGNSFTLCLWLSVPFRVDLTKKVLNQQVNVSSAIAQWGQVWSPA